MSNWWKAKKNQTSIHGADFLHVRRKYPEKKALPLAGVWRISNSYKQDSQKWLSHVCSGGGFGAEDALEARSGELDADVVFAGLLRLGDVHDAAAGGKVALGSPRGVARHRDADLQVGANGHVEAGDEGGSVAAKVFAGGFFLEADAAGIAAAHVERQAHGNSTFRALLRYGQICWDHGLGPPPPRWHGARKSAPRSPALHWVFAPRARSDEARRRSQRHEKTSRRTASFFPQHRGGWQH